MSRNNFAITSVKETYYRNNFWYMSKNKVINIRKIFYFKKESGSL